MSSRGHKMTSAAGIWLATHDETGQSCWVNTATRQRAYRVQDGVQPLSLTPSSPTSVISTPVIPILAPVSPLQAPVITPHEGMAPYNMQSPNMAYGAQYMYPTGGYSGAFPPPSPTGTVGMGTTEYPSGSINWF